MIRARQVRSRFFFLCTALGLAPAILGASCAETPEPPPAAPPTAVETPAPAPAPAPAAPVAAKPAEPTYWKGKKDLITAPPPPEPAALKLPAIVRFKLKNGLDVVIVPRHELPVVSFSMAIRAGSYDESKAHQGVASFTAEMLRKGTKKRKADDISKAIDFVGGSLATYGGSESSGGGCSSLAKDAGLCLDLLADVILNPTFPEDEMQEIRDQMVAGLNQRYDDPSALAAQHFANLVFGEKHPDGWVMMPEDVKKIGRAELVEFWKSYYRPNNAILAVAGDVNPPKLKADLERAFGVWEPKDVPLRPADKFKIPELKGSRVLLVDKDDLTQATVMFGHRGIRHADPAWFAVTMMNYVLGGSDFSSRLTKEVRSRQGLTYGIGSSFGAPLYEGAFRVSTSTKNASAWTALEAAVTEMQRMKKDGPTAEELAKAKGFYAGSYPFRLQSADGVASSIVGAELHGLGVDYVEQFPLRMAAVDPAKAKAAAERFLDPERLVVVIVGRAADIEPQLAGKGFKYEKINFKDPFSYAARKAARKKEEEAVASDEGPKAMALVKQAIAAHGGETALRAIKTMAVKRTSTIKVNGADADVEVRMTYRRPGDWRLDQETMTPDSTRKMAFSVTPAGTKGDPAGSGVMRPPRPNSPYPPFLRRAAFADNNFVLLNILDAKPPLALQLAPAQAGLEGIVVKMAPGDLVTLYFDAKTHLLARSIKRGQQADTIEDYSDYKPVSGVQIAHKIKNSGEDDSEETVKDVKVNAPVDPRLFE